jgi:predicted ATPase/DNA-binding CsgD family transcriptional regulator
VRTPFAQLLRRQRLARGLTQQELADRARLSERSISDLERGVKSAPRLTTVRLLIEALGLEGAEAVALREAVQPDHAEVVDPTLNTMHVSAHAIGPHEPRVASQQDREAGLSSTSRAPLFDIQYARRAHGAATANETIDSGPVHHNLPAHRVHLIGRKHDLALARTELLATEGRLLTMTGTGGCGKTHLALGLASSLLDEFRDGVWLVELAPLADPALIPQSVLSTIGLRERSREPLVQTLVRWIGTRHLLLMLDNCEHLIQACAELVGRLLDACPNLRILATSREPLRVAGELAWRVPSLAVPHPYAPPDELLQSPAVQLFAERARRVRPDFGLTDDSARTVATICRQLEGVPLAVELAAARARTLGVSQILDRLNRSIGLLVSGSRTAPTRQQTMRATLDWSYGLLSPAEQHVFCHLAVFADTFSLEAVESICGGSDPDDTVLETLDRLVDKSMLLAEEREGLVRYRMLEAIRHYAVEQLLARGSHGDARQRHLEYFVAYGEEREQDTNIGGKRRLAATAELVREYPDIRLALEWAIEAKEAQLGLRLARTLQYLWQARGYLTEGAAWFEQLLALPGADEATPAHTVALLGAGRLTTLQGRLDVASAYYERGLPLARRADEPWVRWLGPQNAGLNALARGEPARAGELFREARSIAQAAGNRVCEGISLGAAAFAAWSDAKFEVARDFAEEGLRAHRQTGDEWGESAGLWTLGWVLFSLEEASAARGHFEDSLRLSRKQGSLEWAGNALEGLGRAESAEGRLKEAQRHLIESLDLRRELGVGDTIADSLDGLADVAGRRGQAQRGLRLAGAAEAVRQRLGQTLVPARRQMRDSWMIAVRRDLGEQAAAAFAAGTRLSIDEAIALAHAGDEPVAATVEPLLPFVVRVDSALTTRERQVAVLLARGLSNPQIAAELGISARTAQRHVENILGKLGFGSRAQVAAWAVSVGLVPPDTNATSPKVQSAQRHGYESIGPSAS